MVNSNSCTATFVQLAGIAALQGDQTPVAAMVAEFKRRRDLLVDGLNQFARRPVRVPRGRVLRVPEHHRHRPLVRRGGRSRLLTEAGVARAVRARRSAPTAKATSGSRMRTRRPT